MLARALQDEGGKEKKGLLRGNTALRKSITSKPLKRLTAGCARVMGVREAAGVAALSGCEKEGEL